jgi:hypothetical protein
MKKRIRITHHLSNTALFQHFLMSVHQQAARDLNRNVEQGATPFTVRWEEQGEQRTYAFDTARAREAGLDALVEEALGEIRMHGTPEATSTRVG